MNVEELWRPCRAWGYHVCSIVWETAIGEGLACEREPHSAQDRFAMAICWKDFVCLIFVAYGKYKKFWQWMFVDSSFSSFCLIFHFLFSELQDPSQALFKHAQGMEAGHCSFLFCHPSYLGHHCRVSHNRSVPREWDIERWLCVQVSIQHTLHP